MNAENIISDLNLAFSAPSAAVVSATFEIEAYIRFNNVFISPITLIDFKNKLDEFGLVSCGIVEDGLIFYFGKTFIHFQGFYEIFARERIFSFELNFEPITNTEEGRILMGHIEIFLRKCDALFFLCYTHNVDSVIMQNPLVNSVPFLAKGCKDDLE